MMTLGCTYLAASDMNDVESIVLYVQLMGYLFSSMAYRLYINMWVLYMITEECITWLQVNYHSHE